MLKKSLLFVLLSSAFLGALQADEQTEAYECKRCSLRPRPNTQPNQYEFYEDYLKAQEQKENAAENPKAE